MLLDRIWLLEVKNKAVVSEADVRLYYERNRAQFVQPESVAVQTISTLYPVGATPAQKQAARKRAEAILPRAKAARNYEEFGILAEKFSEDPWRVMMGDRKFLHRSAATPELLIAFSMKPGETSGIIESPDGYVILRVNQHVPQKQMSFAEVQSSIRATLERERLAKRAKSFHESLRKAAKIEVL
jgi:parvulin-like peptidyl-prolyl isomerase